MQFGSEAAAATARYPARAPRARARCRHASRYGVARGKCRTVRRAERTTWTPSLSSRSRSGLDNAGVLAGTGRAIHRAVASRASRQGRRPYIRLMPTGAFPYSSACTSGGWRATDRSATNSQKNSFPERGCGRSLPVHINYHRLRIFPTDLPDRTSSRPMLILRSRSLRRFGCARPTPKLTAKVTAYGTNANVIPERGRTRKPRVSKEKRQTEHRRTSADPPQSSF